MKILVLCVSSAENSPMGMTGLGGSLRLLILFPETTPFPITYNYVLNTTSPRVVLSSGFAMALQVPGVAPILLVMWE